MGIPVGAGTDATRVASSNPRVSLYWMVADKTVGGTPLYPEGNRLDRREALRRYTRRSPSRRAKPLALGRPGPSPPPGGHAARGLPPGSGLGGHGRRSAFASTASQHGG